MLPTHPWDSSPGCVASALSSTFIGWWLKAPPLSISDIELTGNGSNIILHWTLLDFNLTLLLHPGGWSHGDHMGANCWETKSRTISMVVQASSVFGVH